MAITISNKRIVPYNQKDTLKAIYGDSLAFEFGITGHAEGDEYCLVADYETIVYPPLRPVCAMTSDYTYTAGSQGAGTLEMTLDWKTARMRDWASLIAKPMPITLQLVRTRDDVQTTLLLDYILALPSVADAEPTVYPGDPLNDLLASKLDRPEGEGTLGQVPAIGEGGKMVWADNAGSGGSGGVTPEYVSSAISSAVTPVSAGLSTHVANSNIHVTAQEKVTWGGKQDKIDSSHQLPYEYISGTPSIPTSVSQLANDAGYQTSANVDTAVSNGVATRLPLVDTLGTSLTAVAGETISATLSENASLGFTAVSAGQMGIAYALINTSTYTLSFAGTMVQSLEAGKLNFCEILIIGDSARLYVLDSWS